jgi:hypothetical protein
MVPGLYLRLLHRHCSGRWQSQLLPADEIENRSVWNKCEEDAKMREQLTESDVKKIQEEIDYRKLVVRKEAIEAVKEARAHGDLSENFEYHAAKKDKNSNESRIRYLERMLKNANVITDHSKRMR